MSRDLISAVMSMGDGKVGLTFQNEECYFITNNPMDMYRIKERYIETIADIQKINPIERGLYGNHFLKPQYKAMVVARVLLKLGLASFPGWLMAYLTFKSGFPGVVTLALGLITLVGLFNPVMWKVASASISNKIIQKTDVLSMVDPEKFRLLCLASWIRNENILLIGVYKFRGDTEIIKKVVDIVRYTFDKDEVRKELKELGL